MAVSTSDIKYLYSGGVANTDPNLSLGGAPSTSQINTNNLFDNVTASQASLGTTDYRCIYITNDNPTDSFYNADIYVSYLTNGSITVEVGFLIQNDRQYVNISNFANLTGGSLTLTYTDTTNHNFTFAYDSDVLTFASNFQAAINAIGGLEDVTVTGSSSLGSVIFEINFVGGASSRYQEILTLNANNLTYSGSAPVVSITKSVDGGPINIEASPIDVETTAPTGVTFLTTYTINELKGLDVMPVWLKRTVPANTAALENDGFTLKIRGDAVLI